MSDKLDEAIEDLEEFSERQLDRNPKMRASIATVLQAIRPADAAPAAMPGEEEIHELLLKTQRAFQAERDAKLAGQGLWPDRSPAPLNVLAKAISALFAPILAEKETLERANAELVAVVNDRRFVRCGEECYAHDDDPNCALEGEFQRQIEELSARALAAEAALATAQEDAITAYAGHIDVALRDYDDNLRYGDDALGPEFFIERGMERAAEFVRAQIAAPGAAMEARDGH